MRIQVLLSTVNQEDYSLLEKMNICSDAVVVNQCDREGVCQFDYKGYSITWVDSKERGLSRSRNLAINNSTGDILLLCDDDEILESNYVETISKAYLECKDADMIVFNLNLLDCTFSEKLFDKPRRIKKRKTYGSVHLSFKRESVIKNQILFDVRFGTGSKTYLSCEDNLFGLEFSKKRLIRYTYPGIIGSVSYANSSWFTGYDERFFFDKGAFLVAGYSWKRHFYKWYYVLKFSKLSSLSSREILKNLNRGMKGFKKGLNFIEYKEKFLKPKK